ncbi:RNA-directed DNA polymerase, eukaryota [Tanacetum coccineum]
MEFLFSECDEGEGRKVYSLSSIIARSILAIKGVMVDGTWVDDPSHVKNEFCSHFATRFESPSGNRVWACGENKSPGPDGFTFEFFRKFWDVLGKDFSLAIMWFFDHCSFAKGCNSSFIALIPKCIDPKFVNNYRPISLIGSLYKVVTKILAIRLSSVLNNLISELKKKQAMLFKVDFAKAYDSIRWDFLDDILCSFGFGPKWRSWISGSLASGKASVLVNGSPTSEFQFHCGLKQGDPGSRVGIPNDTVAIVASDLGCSTMTTPFKYLGVMVGGRLTLLKSVLGATPIYWMSLFKVPNSVLASMEALRREFFYGAQSNEKKITWVNWPKVLSAKKHGGLGVSSFFALNRLCCYPWSECPGSFSSPWYSIVREIQNLKNKGVDLLSHCKKRVGNGMHTKFWHDIWIGDQKLCCVFPRLFALEEDKDCYVASKFHGSVDLSFRRAARGGVEAQQFAQLRDMLDTVILSNLEDRWRWDLNGSGSFRVCDVRNLLDEFFLPKDERVTRWVKCIPIKINVFAWRVSLDRLPTRLNLIRRGVQVPSTACPICTSDPEDISHLLFRCPMASDIHRLICRWWGLPWSPLGSYAECFRGFKDIRLVLKFKSILEGVCYVSWWCLWIYRNQLLFATVKPRKDVIFDDIITSSFTWCNARSKFSFSWDCWLQHPNLISL